MAAVFKQEAHKLVDELPESAGWNELIYQAACTAPSNAAWCKRTPAS